MTLTGPYAVVTFLDEDDFSDGDDDITSEVPSTWLTATKTECWWPKTADVKSYITKRKPPVKDSRKWILCHVKFEGYYENLEKARSAASTKKSESESSSSQSQGDKPYLRKRKQPLPRVREESTDREDSPDSEHPTTTSMPEPPKLDKKKNMKPSVTNRSTDIPDQTDIQKKKSSPDIPNQTDIPKSSKRSQTKNSNPLSDSQTIIDIEHLPIDFNSTNTNTISIPPARAKHIVGKDTNLSSTPHAFESWPIDIVVDDFDINADNGAADFPSSTKRRGDPSLNASALHPSAHQGLEGHSILFDGSLPDLCNNSQEKTRILIEEKFSALTTLLAEILVTQQLVDRRLAEIEKKVGQHGTVGHGKDFKKVTDDLPFKNTADIQAFENKLADADFCSTFVKYVGQIGGNSAKENTLRILRQVFTNDFAKDASWCGLRANFQLSNLKVTAAIKDGVRLSYTCTDKEFEDTVSEWFRQAKQRFKRENTKKNGPQPHPAANN
ncbi:uncharacterized protein [Neodiprion pinetum]|uniref:Uncharacterized protein LOC124292640 n=1 Tax=Neodiprion lecontei TaxID=441921 RepID=A0ABM3FD52_NEOLC|nr:uncharacterized protein LOC124212242 [Neodiprion pinetum]XP_046485150.1 uncharacterized protein LOC124220392 [Neodiprion pinetum]XP_046485151.1 uncharacterized protein LOC124220393 [Neodiprion pinetum]XP_046585937.1 uncharacterized protein LOC124292640 [Neodiprion lecontei]XP_046585938.1 uncharacterized protein LOC124292640 [Neodiprion lecontei]